MAGRKGNAVGGRPLTITLSEQSLDALNQIAGRGIYGRNSADVAARFVDEALQRLVDFPPIVLKTRNVEQDSHNA